MSVRILYLEDSAEDAELVCAALEAEGIDSDVTRADSKKTFSNALRTAKYDLILSDFSMPGFDGASALAAAAEAQPETPFIFVSGTLGEETAITMLQKGATDYVLKHRLQRLAPAVRRALAEKEERSARRRSEQQMREQAALLDKARDAILVRDLDGRIRFWNKGAERLYGWTAQDVIEHEVPQLFRAKESRKLEDARRGVLEKGEWSGELELVRKDGQTLIAESRWSLIRDELGQPRSILMICTDVTERKKLHAQFLRAQRMESIGSLVGGIAHDLNNVLSPILMATEMLRRKLPDERSRRTLAAVETSARRGADLVKQVLTFARGAEGERIPVQPKHLVTEIEKIARETFPATIQVRTDLPEEAWHVMGDATQLHQVLLNLCVNARDAMPHGGLLTLKVEDSVLDEHYAAMHQEASPGPYVLLSVTDTGTGMPAGLVEKIFEPFFTTKEIGKGTGLGLSTTLAIVKSHGGFVTVYSEVGRGTTFKVYLPATAAGALAAREVARVDPVLGSGQVVLVVDDEASIREITRDTLESSGYKVITASDGAEAVALFAQAAGAVDIVVTDMTMPLMDGAATIHALRRIDPAVKVIATSGLAAHWRDDPASGTSANAFLQKPYRAEDLFLELRRVLDAK